jgi:glycosyltransferase involved in cell wall biosynthesis
LRPALRESARILVPCAEMGADLAALGADPARIEVLPWGVDVARFAPRAPAAVADEVRFAIVCRFTAKKGVADLLGAFALVRRAGVRARLTVAGDGPLRASYLDLIAELGLGDSVAVAGFVSQERLPAFLAEQHVFVHPSVTTQDGDKEGTPTVLMEAQAAGLPVIATRHAGIPDVVADGVSGHLVAEGDVAALAERMIHCARHPEEWPRLGAAGRARVAAGFERGAQSRRREALYDAVAGG